MISAPVKTDAGTVSETVSESGDGVVKNSGELEQFLLETPIKPAILLALIRARQGNPGHWLHSFTSLTARWPQELRWRPGLHEMAGSSA
jgi:hypothetical protein